VPDIATHLTAILAAIKTSSPGAIAGAIVLYLLGRGWRQLEQQWEHERKLRELEAEHRRQLDLQVLDHGLGAPPAALRATVAAIRDLRDPVATDPPPAAPVSSPTAETGLLDLDRRPGDGPASHISGPRSRTDHRTRTTAGAPQRSGRKEP